MLLPLIFLNLKTVVTCLNSIAKIVVHCFLSVLISALKLTIHLRMSFKQLILDRLRRGKPKCYDQKRRQVLVRRAITRNKMKYTKSNRETKIMLNKKRREFRRMKHNIGEIWKKVHHKQSKESRIKQERNKSKH